MDLSKAISRKIYEWLLFFLLGYLSTGSHILLRCILIAPYCMGTFLPTVPIPNPDKSLWIIPERMIHEPSGKVRR